MNMTQALATKDQNAAQIVERVITTGNLAELTPQDRVNYYRAVCESVGLNPLTRPFEYIVLNGKLTLYARKDCTDQLRTIHDVSVDSLDDKVINGVYVVNAKVHNGKGRTDMAKGAVHIDGLKGDALANALMKAETKAKRRATLSLCGLGFLEESELETIPADQRQVFKEPPQPAATKDTAKEGGAAAATGMTWHQFCIDAKAIADGRGVSDKAKPALQKFGKSQGIRPIAIPSATLEEALLAMVEDRWDWDDATIRQARQSAA
jgi:hypothetical protein